MESTPIRLYVHVEEPSMMAVMHALLPRLIDEDRVVHKIIEHGSKTRLLSDLEKRLKGYLPRMAREDIRVLVLVDRDDDDCRVLKTRLEATAGAVGLRTAAAGVGTDRVRVVNRIVCEELEAWYLGDVPALRAVYPRLPAVLRTSARFRDPDAVKGGTHEALFRVLQRAGYYRGASRLPKMEVARRVSPHMTPETNRSTSFGQFVSGLNTLLA